MFEELCMEPLDLTHGVPMGIEYDPFSIAQEDAFELLTEDGQMLQTSTANLWRFAVEIAIVTNGGLLGTFVLGTSVLGGPRWNDVTQDCEGLHWNRGGEPTDRPIAGAASIRLNNDSGYWSPWNSPFFGPGTMVRIVVSDGTTLINQLCGQTVVWNEACEGLGAYEWVDITVWENMFLLSSVDDHGLAGVVGGGDTLTQRVDRLMTQADWQFGIAVFATPPATFQATDFAQDVLTELYRTVDGVDAVVYPAKDGMLIIRDRTTGSGVSWVYERPDQDPDSIVTANDDDRILSSVDLARVGGTVVHFDNAGIAGRYQRRSTQRTDMITVAEPGDADLARVAYGILARGRQTYRPVTFAVESGQGLNQAKMIIEADITDRVTLNHDEVIFADYPICAVEHDVTVAAAGIYWRASFALDIEADSSWNVKTPARVGTARVGATYVGTL